MARIAGIDLPKNKRGVIGLTYIFGVGRSSASEILAKANVSEDTKINDWNDDNIKTISRIVNDEYKVEGELRSEVQLSIKRLMDIACYRGLRHLFLVGDCLTTTLASTCVSPSTLSAHR